MTEQIKRVIPAKPCFFCGEPMDRLYGTAAFTCKSCGYEERPSTPGYYFDREGITWAGQFVRFIDHGAERVPSPA